jgi:uncharacterized protein (DUF4415 family)
MTANKPDIGGDLDQVDAREIAAAGYGEAPEPTDGFFDRAEQHAVGRLVRRGRPPSGTPKRLVSLRLDQDIIDRFRSTGPGWQSRINAVLREHAPDAG